MNSSGVSLQDLVLLIDDDELVAGSLREYLVRGGARVDVAAEPITAERLMRELQYDVIVVDPYLTGGVRQDDEALLMRIRSLQPDATMIVLTGYTSPSLALIAGREGAAALLAKPQSVPYLGEVVTNATRRVRGSAG